MEKFNSDLAAAPYLGMRCPVWDRDSLVNQQEIIYLLKQILESLNKK